jgi:hypothetical protein
MALAQEASGVAPKILEERGNPVPGSHIFLRTNEEEPWARLRHSIVTCLDDCACHVIVRAESLLKCSGKVLDYETFRSPEVRLEALDIFHEHEAWTQELDKIQIRLEQLVPGVVRLASARMGEPLARRATCQQVDLAGEVDQCLPALRQ